MAGFPVVCERCGQIFEHPAFDVGGPGLTLIANDNTRIGPHPGCGGYGRPAGGTYKFVETGVELLLRSAMPADDLSAILALLERAHGAVTIEGIEAEIEKAPAWVQDFLGAIDRRLEAANVIDARRFRIGVLLAVIGIYLGLFPPSQGAPNATNAMPALTQTPTREEIDRIVQRALQETRAKLAPKLPAARSVTAPNRRGRREEQARRKTQKRERVQKRTQRQKRSR